ncbi:MAG: class E sortase [Actinobacteria bacterium]|nr:class E sortase [Actinomycetota bacterium]
MVAKLLGVLGRVFILAGLFILGFVAFQLWGTGIEEGRNQTSLSDQLTKAAPSGSRIDDAGNPADVAKALATVNSATAPSTPAPEEGDPVGIIEIPRIDLARVIVQGVSKADLKKGPGHYPGTPLPGQAGNSGIAGHRTTYGAPFNRIDELRPGDEITITTPQGRFVYKVIPAPGSDTAWYTVKPTDGSVLDDKGDNRITLTACHPKYSARQRIVVNAVLEAPPAPTSPPPVHEVTTRTASLDEGLAGDTSALLPALLFVGGAVAIGLLAWFVGRHWRKVPTWVVATPVILVLVWFSYVYLDRYLPSI